MSTILEFFGYSGAQGTHADGRDGIAYQRKSTQVGHAAFPYGQDGTEQEAGSYGQPGANGRTSGKKTPSNGKAAAERGDPIGSDGNETSEAGDPYSIEREKQKRMSEAWAVLESMGAPFNVAMASKGTMTPTIPGMQPASQNKLAKDNPDDLLDEPEDTNVVGKKPLMQTRSFGGENREGGR